MSFILHKYLLYGNTNSEVKSMSYVAPVLREKFETLPINLKNVILEREVQIHTMQDLIHVLEEIVQEGDPDKYY